MRIKHCIKSIPENDNWREWVREHIGQEGIDYVIDINRTEVYNERNELVQATNDPHWEIPDPAKAMLFILKYS